MPKSGSKGHGESGHLSDRLHQKAPRRYLTFSDEGSLLTNSWLRNPFRFLNMRQPTIYVKKILQERVQEPRLINKDRFKRLLKLIFVLSNMTLASFRSAFIPPFLFLSFLVFKGKLMKKVARSFRRSCRASFEAKNFSFSTLSEPA